MTTLEKILVFLDSEMTTPEAFGWFHLLFIAITIVTTLLLVIFARKVNDNKFRAILIITASILLLFEVYKQINFAFDSNTLTWEYEWYAFPFQFCSTPMYIMLLAGILKPNKNGAGIQNSLLAYLCTYSIFAGVCVMIIPNDVFISTIGINIQTMVHHSSMIIIGVYILSTKRVKFNLKTFLKGFAVFVTCVAIAMTLNIVVFNSGILNGQTFNMFFISPYFDCSLIILSDIYVKVPYIVFLLIYILGFTIAAKIVYFISELISNSVLQSNQRRFRKKVRAELIESNKE